MPTLTGNVLRVALNQSSRVGLLDSLTEDKVVFYQGLPAKLQCALFLDTPAVDTFISGLNNIDSIELVVRKHGPDGSILFAEIVESSDFDVATTYETWLNETKQHFVFNVSNTDTTQTVPSSNRLPIYFLVTVNLTNNESYIAGFGYGEIVNIGYIENPIPGDYVDGRTQIVGGKLLSDFDLNGYDIVDSSGLGYTEDGEETLTDGQLEVVVSFGWAKTNGDGYRLDYAYIKDGSTTPRDVRAFLKNQTTLGLTFELTAGATVGSILYWRVIPKLNLPTPRPTPRYVQGPVDIAGRSDLDFIDLSSPEWGLDMTGNVDETNGLVEAIAEAAETGKRIYISGFLGITQEIIKPPTVHIFGKNNLVSGLKWIGNAGGRMMQISTGDASGVGLSRLRFQANRLAASCLYLNETENGQYDAISIVGFMEGDGLDIVGGSATASWNEFYGLVLDGDSGNNTNGTSCIRLRSIDDVSGNACHNRFWGSRVFHGGNRPAWLLERCDNNTVFSAWIQRQPGGTGAGFQCVPGGGFPSGNEFYHMQAGLGGWVQPIGTSTAPGTIFGYHMDNGQPAPVTYGTPLFWFSNAGESHLGKLYTSGIVNVNGSDNPLGLYVEQTGSAAFASLFAALAYGFNSNGAGFFAKQNSESTAGTVLGDAAAFKSEFYAQNSTGVTFWTNNDVEMAFGPNGVKALILRNGTIKVPTLPTSDPHVAGQLWRSTNDVKVSTG